MNELTLMKKPLQNRPKFSQYIYLYSKSQKTCSSNVISRDFPFRKLFKIKIE